MTQKNHSNIPKWILWYGAIVMAGFPFLTAIMTFTGPDLGLLTLADGTEVASGNFKYAVRNLAAAIVMAFALYRRSAAMLIIVFIMRFITESGDLIDSLLFGDLGTIGTLGFVGLMIVFAFVPYTIAIRQLWPIARS